MQVKEIKNEGLKREYKVTIPAKDIDTQLEKKIEETAKKTKLPGFRPGKVPLSVVKKKHGAALMGEVVEQAVSKASVAALKKEDVRPAQQPKISITSFDEGKDLEFDITLEIYPDVPKVDYKKISLKKWEVEILEKDIQDGLERLAKANRDFAAPKKKRAAKKGDMTIIDFEGRVDGEVFAGGTAKGFQLELGSGQFIPGFEEQLEGAKEGDEKIVKVDFPAEYHSQELAGKPAEFTVNVHEIKEPKDAEINDDLATKVGLENLDKLKEEIEAQIKKDFDQLIKMKLKRDLFDELENKCKFDIPEGMLNDEVEALWKPEEERLKEAKATDKEITKEKKEIEKLADRRVRLGIFLSDLGSEKDLNVSPDELRQAAMEQAKQYPGQEQQVLEFYQSNPNMLEQLKGPILEDKVVDYLLDNITVKMEKTTTKALMDFYEKEQAQN